MPIFIVVGTGLLGTIAVLAISMRIGRDEPHHRVPWIIALVALGLDSAIHIAISVGVLLAFYPPRMLIVGALLVWSARPTREHADNTQKEESPASTG